MYTKPKIHFAPLQGYADHVFRRLHHQLYGGVDMYYTPFIRVEHGEARRQDVARLRASMADGTPVTPQIIFKDLTEFDILVGELRRLGCTSIDLNMGCPYPMQTRRGRGCATLQNPQFLQELCVRISALPDITFSVKMRLGMAQPDEWRAVIDELNAMRLSHIALHPRVATQMYDGELFESEFDAFAEQSAHPMIWNGDVRTPGDIDRVIEAHPRTTAIMIGRGFLARPSLAEEWLDGAELSDEEKLTHMIEFHNRILADYSDTLCGDAQILQKIKPFWEYAEPLIGRKAYKALHKAGSMAKYMAAVNSL